MNPYRTGIYIACALGAVALMLIMPKEKPSLAKVGLVLGAITMGGFWVYILREQAPEGEPEFAINGPSFLYHYLFSGIAIFSAVRVITHKQPVFSALWFIMVVLASAGLLLTLNAEFIAFAMVIIYGGAILVTYVFVIMLAAQAGDPAVDKAGGKTSGLSFDNEAKDPALGTIIGFFLLAMLLSILLNPTMKPVPATAQVSDASLIKNVLVNRPSTLVYTAGTNAEIPEHMREAARASDVLSDKKLDNTERVGVDLFKNHPLGLELAGVILLLSLVGAVVIARKRVETEAPPGGGGH